MDKKQPRSQFMTVVAVVLITAVAAVLRLWGIRWGLPDALHNLTYHPDEIFQIGAMAQLNSFRLMLDPGFYNYPSGYMNLGAIVIRVLEGWGMSFDDSGYFLVARVIVAVLGIATIPLVYSAAAKLYGRAAGIIASLLIAIMPLHIVHSHFATVDVPATLWVTVAILGSAIILGRPSWKTYLWTGLAVGFAVGTKYNAALVIIPAIVAHFLREDSRPFVSRLRCRMLWIMLGAVLLGFVVSTPGNLLWPDRYWGGFLYEMNHVATGHGLVFKGRGPGWLDVLTNSLGYGLGVFMLVMTLLSVACAFARNKRQDWVLLSFLIPYFLLISFSEVRFARYAIPMLPVIAILVGRLIADIYSVLKEQGAAVWRWGWAVVAAAAIVYTMLYAVAFDRLFSLEDPRTEAARWFQTNVSPGTTVGFATVPWFYSPPLAQGIVGTPGSAERYEAMSESRYHLLANPYAEWDTSVLTTDRAAFVVISDYEAEDPLRLRVPEAVRFYKELDVHYAKVAEFGHRLSVFGIDFGPAENLPHDLKYMSPTIRVYGRN